LRDPNKKVSKVRRAPHIPPESVVKVKPSGFLKKSPHGCAGRIFSKNLDNLPRPPLKKAFFFLFSGFSFFF
jgi:hypothetical protein